MSRAADQLNSFITHAIKMGVVVRAYFDRSTQVAQVEMLDEDDVDEMPVYGPPGVAFRYPEGAEVIVVHPMADASLPSIVGMNQRDARPTEKPGGGEVPHGAGGLHFLGEWRVYVDDQGRTFLGGAADTSEPALLGQTFLTLYNAHTHGSPFGPTTAPLVSGDTAKSTKVFLPPNGG